MRLGPVSVADGRCTPAEHIRHNHHLKDCQDGFRLDIVARGSFQLSHAGEERTYDVGWGFFCITHGRTGDLLHVASATEMLRCSLPRLKPL
jgi:hypothetical protein